jgi:hypothetical protein
MASTVKHLRDGTLANVRIPYNHCLASKHIHAAVSGLHIAHGHGYWWCPV